MGNIRVPKTIYKNGFEMAFSVKKKEIIYVIYKWVDDGCIRVDLESGKLGTQNPKDVLNKVLSHLFTNVMGIEK